MSALRAQRGHWWCLIRGHLWWQPEGIFTHRECRRCGVPDSPLFSRRED